MTSCRSLSSSIFLFSSTSSSSNGEFSKQTKSNYYSFTIHRIHSISFVTQQQILPLDTASSATCVSMTSCRSLSSSIFLFSSTSSSSNGEFSKQTKSNYYSFTIHRIHSISFVTQQQILPLDTASSATCFSMTSCSLSSSNFLFSSTNSRSSSSSSGEFSKQTKSNKKTF